MRVLFIAQQTDYEPQGIMHLSSALKAAGHEVDLAVATHQDPVAAAREFQPDVAAYSVITGSQRYYIDVNNRVKREVEGVFSVFGGPHPTFFPEMVEEEGVDGICRGEGEDAMVELVNALAAGGPEAVLGIANWSFKRNGDSVDAGIINNPVRPYVGDLDGLPFPDRALVYERDAISARSKIKHFLTGRGCPYNCTYCFNHALSELYRGKGRRFRQR
ncbi:MAG: cobalamin B12-binding domain-containing protein, partial [Anaerolineae bacterium]